VHKLSNSNEWHVCYCGSLSEGQIVDKVVASDAAPNTLDAWLGYLLVHGVAVLCLHGEDVVAKLSVLHKHLVKQEPSKLVAVR